MDKQKQTEPPLISISVVSHGQMSLVEALLTDIEQHCAGADFEVILTLNIPERCNLDKKAWGFPLRWVDNVSPKGFGANHNAAFGLARGRYFCVVNPDIRFDACPLNGLLVCFDDPLTGIAAPVVFGPGGEMEDSARRFPTPGILLKKLLGFEIGRDYPLDTGLQQVQWCAGMFMMFERQVFADLSGFDERYFLYYEDVDICARLFLSGRRVMVNTRIGVVHHAQRSSHRRLRYTLWHLRSIARHFLSPVYRQLHRTLRRALAP